MVHVRHVGVAVAQRRVAVQVGVTHAGGHRLLMLVLVVLVVHVLVFVLQRLMHVLMFVAIKMGVAHWYKLPIWLSLGIVAGILAVGVILSLLRAPKRDERLPEPAPAEVGH